MPVDVMLTGALLPDGTVTNVPVEAGHVARNPGPAASSIDLGGRLLLPAMAEAHAHLDKAFTAERFPNPTGDLATAIEAMRVGWPSIDQDDVEDRATRAARRLLASGTTAIRTHADLNPEAGLKSVFAMTEVRDRMATLMDIQVVALASFLTGAGGAEGRALLTRGIDAGIDVVGSCPHLEADPVGTIELTLVAAKEAGLLVDFHFDEILDAGIQHLADLARLVDEHGLGGSVTASHCVSHGMLDPFAQRDIARALADTGVSVIVNPRTNLFLQARGIEQAAPRGLPGIAAMVEEGVLVAAGADNVQDPFCLVGRSDPLETASLLVAVAHRTVDEAWRLVSSQARAVMGLAVPSLEAGSPADFVAIRAGSLREAVADQSPDRMVIRRGALVARTSVTAWVADG
jgi:cytosine deaminase